MTVLATTAFTIILVGIVFVEKTGKKPEEFLQFVPFKERAMNLSFRQRLILVVSFVIVGNFALMLALVTKFGKMTEANFFSFIRSRFVSAIVVGLIDTIADIHRLTKNFSRRLDDMGNFLTELARGKYNLKLLPIASIDKSDF